MIIEVKIPSPGESITEVEVGSLLVDEGSRVEKDQEVAEIESEKATLPIIAPEGGKIHFLLSPGDTAKVGDVICTIDTEAAAESRDAEKEPSEEEKMPKEGATPSTTPDHNAADEPAGEEAPAAPRITPLAKKKMEAYGLSVEDVLKGLRRLTAGDVDRAREALQPPPPAAATEGPPPREKEEAPMTPLRKKLSERLVAVKNETAMLTTFNEVDMNRVIALRKKHQEAFVRKHGIKLGFMSFFIRASALALLRFPAVNSMIDGERIVTFRYADIGVAVQTDKGLMVPVIRNAERLDLAAIERTLKELADKARRNRITLEEMSGGTFTITNGGVFGSMLSTPLLNPPQAAILGMHNIVERPVAVDGKVEIRPVMYVALSYDHRLIDGRDSVGFLRTVKEMLERPEAMLFGGDDPERVLLNL